MTQPASLATNTRNNQALCCLVEAGGSWYKEVHTLPPSVQALLRIAIKTALTFNPVLPTKYHSAEYKIVQLNTVEGTYLTAKGLIGTARVTHHLSHT